VIRLFRLGRLVGLSSILFASACGQKGPPLAPIVYLPRPVTEVVAKRFENEVVLQFTVPTLNTDNTGPADLRRVEVYAHTGPLPAAADFLKYGTLVASVNIKQPKIGATDASGTEGVTGSEGATSASEAEGASVDAAGATTPLPAKAPAKPDPEAGMVEQGWNTSVRETLTPKHMEIGPMPPTRPLPVAPDDAPVVVVEKIETPGTVNFDVAPQRFYTIVGVSDSRNRRGPFFGPIPVALIEPLSPPEKVDLEYNAERIALNWPGQPEDMAPGATGAVAVAAPGAPGAATPTAPVPPAVPPAPVAPSATPPVAAAPAGPPLDRETEGTVELFADVETDLTQDVLVAVIDKVPTGAKPKPRPPVAAAAPPAPRFGYNVYESTSAPVAPVAPNAPDTPTAPNAPGSAAGAPTAPLNATLLTAPGFADPRVEFGTERCYVVRRVEMAGTVAIESAPSRPVCVTPVDTFPPAPPKSLAHIAGGNGVSLLWEANTETDLGGYVVLRGEAPGDKLSPLTKEPISDTSFLDTTVRRGRTYVYEVIAVDVSTPPNQSAPSNRVEETIR
jgi:hypothetical protein